MSVPLAIGEVWPRAFSESICSVGWGYFERRALYTVLYSVVQRLSNEISFSSSSSTVNLQWVSYPGTSLLLLYLYQYQAPQQPAAQQGANPRAALTGPILLGSLQLQRQDSPRPPGTKSCWKPVNLIPKFAGGQQGSPSLARRPQRPPRKYQI